ncbi:MAG TPA: hypothetical protein VFN23_06165 [Ktedonobacteraceae bacterium]|nr:hypothetical protein [Ktedonobacteraceae bacterium]
MYTLDLQTILQLLQDFKQRGTLQTQIPNGVPGVKERCLVWIEFVSGEIASCTIQTQSGKQVLTAQKALNTLYGLGALDWELITLKNDAPLIYPQQMSPATSSPVNKPSTQQMPVLPQQPYPPTQSYFPQQQPEPLTYFPQQQPNPSTGPFQPTTGPFSQSQQYTPPPQNGNIASPIPRWAVYVDRQEISRWPRKYRRIFSLVDGERSVYQIAITLGLPSTREVLEVLRELRNMGMIMMNE